WWDRSPCSPSPSSCSRRRIGRTFRSRKRRCTGSSAPHSNSTRAGFAAGFEPVRKELTMKNTKKIDQSQSGRSRSYERLTPESALLMLIDHQAGLVSGIRDLEPDEVRHNAVAFARAARVLRIPVVLTSTAPMMWGPTLPELTQALPGVENIERSVVNAWDEPRVRDAVARTGRRKLMIAGGTTPS